MSAEELAALFGGRTRFVDLLAKRESPLREARQVLRELPEDDQIEALNAHPRIGARRLSGASAVEQGEDEDPEVLARLSELNRAYEEKFGFRFLVFVNRRPKRDLLPVLEDRLGRTREEELATALDELVAIAHDRWEMNIHPPTP